MYVTLLFLVVENKICYFFQRNSIKLAYSNQLVTSNKLKIICRREMTENLENISSAIFSACCFALWYGHAKRGSTHKLSSSASNGN